MAILTLSREYGSGGREIGQSVARSMAYEYVDKERILDDIRQLGQSWEQWSQELDEHSPTIWEKYDWSFRGFAALVERIILGYALRDNVVIMGRGGNHILKEVPHALKVHIVAPIESRVTRVMDRESVNRETAMWMIEKVDRERAGYVYSIHGRLWDDPADYDYTLNTGFKSLEEITQAIVGLLQERDKVTRDAGNRALSLRFEAARIRAGLLTNPRLSLPTLDVRFDGKQIVLKGIVHNPKEYTRVAEEAKMLAGDTTIRVDLHYRS